MKKNLEPIKQALITKWKRGVQFVDLNVVGDYPIEDIQDAVIALQDKYTFEWVRHEGDVRLQMRSKLAYSPKNAWMFIGSLLCLLGLGVMFFPEVVDP
jgi:hypothetical protein